MDTNVDAAVKKLTQSYGHHCVTVSTFFQLQLKIIITNVQWRFFYLNLFIPLILLTSSRLVCNEKEDGL